ncbi:MAG: hypothetical protein EPN82_00390 [Bacteroidetes bacterium]|nr:MAG: hypothetical protein EPN82_00390 [Bacteroidota bacterium]
MKWFKIKSCFDNPTISLRMRMFSITLGIVLLFIFNFGFLNTALAQNYVITITLNIVPPYSPYYSDYFEGKNNTFITLQNTDQVVHEIKLGGMIKGVDNGIVISTKPGSKPLTPITLQPNVPMTLSGMELKRYIDVRDLDVVGIEREKLMRSASLPEGIYDICYRAYDYNTGEPLSLDACANITIAYPEPPILIHPANEDTLKSISVANPVLFTWIGSPTAPMGTIYNLQIAKMVNPGDNPNAVMYGTTQFYFDRQMTTSDYIALPNDPPFVNGENYAWRVVARDPMGKIQFKNNGISEAWKFTYKTGESEVVTDTIPSTTEKGIDIIIPKCKEVSENTEIPKIEVNNHKNFYILWKNNTAKQSDTAYIKYLIHFINSSNIDFKQFEVLKNTSLQLPEGTAQNESFDTINADYAYLNLLENVSSLYFSSGKTYRFYVEAYNSSNQKNTESKMCEFTYMETPDTTDANKMVYNITGQLLYKFQDYVDEYPVNSPNVKLKRYLMIRDTVTNNILIDSLNPNLFEPGQVSNDYPVTLNEDGSFNVPIIANKNAGDLNKYVSQYIQKKVGNSYTMTLYKGRLFEYYVLLINNPYYLEINKKIELNADSINIGKVVTYVWSYKLTFEVGKGYNKGNFKDLNPQNVKVNIYRMGSKQEIPYYEGEIKVGDPKVQLYQMKQVSQGKVETVIGSDGKAHTIVTIDKLIVNWMNGDNYLVDLWQEEIVNGQVKKNWSEYWLSTQKYFPNLYELVYNYINNIYNFKVYKKATIISNNPPTASVSGQLVSRDPSDPKSNIKPMNYRQIGLMVTYYVEDNNGKHTIIDPYHVTEANESGAVSVINTGQQGAKLEADLTKPFGDGNTLLATTTTNGEGRFVFKNFAHIDSLGSWNSSGQFGTGSGEFCNVAGFNGKLHRTTRVVVIDYTKQYIYNPSDDIPIQPLDSIDVGTLIAYKRTYKLTVVPRKNPKNLEQSEPGGVIYGSTVKITRWDNFVQGEQFVDKQTGVGFSGLFMHNKKVNWDDFKIEISTSDTVGENSYQKKIIYFPRGYDDWKKDTAYSNNKEIDENWENYGTGTLSAAAKAEVAWQNYQNQMLAKIDEVYYRNEYDFLFIEDYKPVSLSINVYLEPKKPIISGRVLDASNAMRSVNFGIVSLYWGKETDDSDMKLYTGTGGCARVVGEAFQNGYFVFKDLPAKYTNVNHYRYRLKFNCPGYYLYGANKLTGSVDTVNQTVSKECIPPVPNAISLKMGQQMHFPQVLMMPKGTVYGYVIDEDGKAVECYVRTKNGKMVKTEDAAYLKEFELQNLNYTPILEQQNIQINKTKSLKKQDLKMKMFQEKEESDDSKLVSMQNIAILNLGQKFTVKIPTMAADTLFIFPIDLKYFNDTIVIPALQNLPNDTTNYYLGKIVVKERKHRIIIGVTNSYTKQHVPNCRVKILDYEDTTDANGKASFEFKNASLKNFWLKIDPPDTSDLIPISSEIQNEESKEFKSYQFLMKPGMTVKGKVAVNGKPVPYATIYVLNGYNTNIRKTKTDANGDYILKGINPQLGNKNEKPWINMRCVPPDENPPKDSTGQIHLPGQLPGTEIDPNIDYPNLTGQEKRVDFEKGLNYVYECNFELTEFTAANLQRLHGFHIKVHKIVSKPNGDYELNGYVDFSKSANAFELLDSSQYAGFGSLNVRPDKQKVDDKGRPYFEAMPGSPTFPLTLPAMKVRLKGQQPAPNTINLEWGSKTFNYNVLLMSKGQGINYLEVVKDSVTAGHLSSKGRIVDNSFNFPGSYFRFQDDQFYLAGKKDTTYDKMITSFENCIDSVKFSIMYNFYKHGKLYYLTDANLSKLKFKFLEFDADSKIENSSLNSQGIIYLLPHAWSNIRLDPQNPATTLVEVNIPTTSITSEGVATGGKIPKLEIKFEDWTVVAKNCEVSPDVGGIKSTDSKILTGTLDIPIGEFNLRHDFLYIAKPNVTKLTLGGICSMFLTNPQSAQFGLDPKCGLDLKPHYKLIFIGDPAATVPGLPGFATSLKLQAVSLLSDGEQIVSFSPGCEKMALYDIAFFKPLAIYSYADMFTIDGLMDYDIPRVANGLTYKLKYTKPGASLVMQMLPTDITFDGPGYVKFESRANYNQQLISYRDLKLYGTVREPGKLDTIFIILNKHKSNNQISIAINRDPGVGDQFIDLGGAQGGKFRVDSSRMVVKSNDWDVLRLKLYPVGSFSEKGFGDKPLNLAVYGEIKTDADVKNQKITTSGTNTEFGDFTMTFDLPNARFIGTLNFEDKQIGTIKISGCAEICIDPHGFYFAAAAEAEVTPIGVFSVGLLIGIYDAGGKMGGIPQATLDMVTSHSIGKGLPCAFENATMFAGFFVTGRKSIPQLTFNESINLVIASASVSLEVGVEAAAWANFASPITGGVSVMLYAVAELKLSAITCTSLYAKAEAIIKGQFIYTYPQDIIFNICASINIYGKLEQKMPILVGCDGTIFTLGSDTEPFISLKADVSVGTNGVDCSISTGSCSENCSSVVQ